MSAVVAMSHFLLLVRGDGKREDDAAPADVPGFAASSSEEYRRPPSIRSPTVTFERSKKEADDRGMTRSEIGSAISRL